MNLTTDEKKVIKSLLERSDFDEIAKILKEKSLLYICTSCPDSIPKIRKWISKNL